MRLPEDDGTGFSAPMNALVLTGGGARGAYEVGVVSYIVRELFPELGSAGAFRLFAGTSAGALNACTLASLAHAPVESIRQIQEYWRSITMERIVRFGYPQLRRLPDLLLGKSDPLPKLVELARLLEGSWLGQLSTLIGRKKREGQTGRVRAEAASQVTEAGREGPEPVPGRRAPHPPVAGVFDTGPLYRDMSRRIPWGWLQENIRQGTVLGIALCATEVCTSQSVVFYQTHEADRYHCGPDRSRKPLPVEIGVAHAMASAAIPFLFDAVQVKGICYVDGAMRQNIPLDPAIRMGADRIVIVGLSQESSARYAVARQGCQRNPFPGWQFLLGRTVHAVMDGVIDSEVKRLEVINQLITGGLERYGPEFLSQLNQLSREYRNQDYRVIQICHIRPSLNLNELAIQAIEEAPQELQLPGLAGKVMTRILTLDSMLDSDLSSFLLFTPTYIAKLLELGYQDARAHREELRRMFGWSSP